MTYVPPNTVIPGEKYTSAAHNIIVDDIVNHESRIVAVEGDIATQTVVQTGDMIVVSPSSIPAGYLACDGSAVSRTLYSDLFNTIGTQYGEGDGSTTFNLPEFDPVWSFKRNYDLSFAVTTSNPSTFYVALQQTDGKVIIGGSGQNIMGVLGQNHIVRLNSDGTHDATFAPVFNSQILGGFLQPDGKIVVWGDFSTVNGTSRIRLARLNPDGSLDSWNPIPNSNIRGMALQADGKIVFVGSFGTVNAVARSRIARVNVDGSLDTSFDPGADSTVQTLAIQPDGKILFGGYFNTIAGNSKQYFARLNADGTFDASFTTTVNSDVQKIIILNDGSIFVNFPYGNTVNGSITRFGVFKLNPDLTVADWPANSPSSFIFDYLTINGKHIFVGSFSKLETLEVRYAIRFNSDLTPDTTWSPFLSGDVKDVLPLSDGRLLLVGNFQQAGGYPQAGQRAVSTYGVLLLKADSPPEYSSTGYSLRVIKT